MRGMRRKQDEGRKDRRKEGVWDGRVGRGCEQHSRIDGQQRADAAGEKGGAASGSALGPPPAVPACAPAMHAQRPWASSPRLRRLRLACLTGPCPQKQAQRPPIAHCPRPQPAHGQQRQSRPHLLPPSSSSQLHKQHYRRRLLRACVCNCAARAGPCGDCRLSCRSSARPSVNGCGLDVGVCSPAPLACPPCVCVVWSDRTTPGRLSMARQIRYVVNVHGARATAPSSRALPRAMPTARASIS